MRFEPDFENIVNAAKNITPDRLPQYDHSIDHGTLEVLTDSTFVHLSQSPDPGDRRKYWEGYAAALRSLGYDIVIFEAGVTGIVNGSRSLKGMEPGPIQSPADFDAYPWNLLHDRFFEKYDEAFSLLCETMPDGMKAAGGIGNGVFELLQEFVRYTELCMMMFENPDLFQALARKIGDVLLEIWTTFMKTYGDSFCLLRFGDDLGFKTSTLVSDTHIKEFIIPQYKRIIDLVHSYDKPFLLHSCGNIFSVMESLISDAGIDAKHSNEDEIAPFSAWVERYGDRIGNFGGIDMNVLVTESPENIRKYTLSVIENAADAQGFACGSGNSVPDYVPPEKYKVMLDTIQEYRGSKA